MNPAIVDILKTASVTVPAWELAAAFISVSLCMLFRFNQLGLLISYLFTFRLGWIFCQTDLLTKPQYEAFGPAYLAFGGLVLFLTIIGLVWRPPES